MPTIRAAVHSANSDDVTRRRKSGYNYRAPGTILTATTMKNIRLLEESAKQAKPP